MTWDLAKDRPSRSMLSVSDPCIRLADMIYEGLIARTMMVTPSLLTHHLPPWSQLAGMPPSARM